MYILATLTLYSGMLTTPTKQVKVIRQLSEDTRHEGEDKRSLY